MTVRQARLLDTMVNFCIFPITLKPGKIHVLGDEMCRDPHEKDDASFHDVEVLFISFEDDIVCYEDGQFFAEIIKALN